MSNLLTSAPSLPPSLPALLTGVVSLVAYVVSLYEPIRATELAFRK